LEKNVVIIGGGSAGISAAVELSKAGIPSIIIEKENAIGGFPLKFSCKAVEQCTGCGLCQFNEILNEFEIADKTNLLTSSQLENLKGNFGNFNVTVSQKNGNDKIDNLTLPADAIIVATGGQPFDAKQKIQFGYKKFKNVITGLELEEKLRAGGKDIEFDGKKPKEVAFIQCVGSRDENINKGFCSKVCCRYALRMANILKEKIKDVNITIFYMDLQTTGKDILSTYNDIKDKFEFINVIPTYVKEKDGKLEVRFDDIKNGKMGYKEFDLVVLSVGISPNKGNKDLAKMLGININRFGFYDLHDSCETNKEGVFLAGTSIAPMSIVDSIASAKNAVYKIISKIRG